MFYKKTGSGYKDVLPGVKVKTLSHGTKTLLAEFKLSMGTVIPEHHHLHEQTGYLVSGLLVMTIDNETFDVKPGDSWCIESDLPHEVQVVEDALVIEVFSPLREDYLPNNTNNV